MKLAARWIGEFHAANEARAAEASRSFLTAYDAAYYRGWPRRAFRLARRLDLPLPWLRTLCKRIEEEIVALAQLPQTVIHGEYYPHNIMFQAGVIRPVDWETAAIAPINPRNFAPTQTATPTTFGPGMNWQRLRMSANSSSLIQRRCSTVIRRAQTSPPPKLQSETLRNAMNSEASATCSTDFRSSAIRGGSCMIGNFKFRG